MNSIRQLLHRWFNGSTLHTKAESIADELPIALTPNMSGSEPASQRMDSSKATASAYDIRVTQERERFAKELDVNDLPPIFHYWSNRYLRPMFEQFGFSNPDEFFAHFIQKQIALEGREVRVLSVGAGNCDTEVRVGKLLMGRGEQQWQMTCLDLVPEMLERGRQLSLAENLAERFQFEVRDFNQWQDADATFDVIIANQCLHHVVELERLFEQVKRLLTQRGRFLTSDIVGKNGHQRWPEAKSLVDQFWNELPESYRYNQQLRRMETEFLDWDCSQEGFEGIRAQDILPLLQQHFGFDLFLAFNNLIDPFVDRSFGWNFNADAAWDRDLIDRIQAADDVAIDNGTIKPTHLLAVMNLNLDSQPIVWRNRTVDNSIRRTDDYSNSASTKR